MPQSLLCIDHILDRAYLLRLVVPDWASELDFLTLEDRSPDVIGGQRPELRLASRWRWQHRHRHVLRLQAQVDEHLGHA